MLHPRPLFSLALAVLRVQATLLAVVTVTQLWARCCWIVLMRSLSVLVQARLSAFMMVKQLVGADAAGLLSWVPTVLVQASLLAAVTVTQLLGQILLNRGFKLMSATRGSALNVMQVRSKKCHV